MAVVTVQLADAALADWPAVVLLVASAVLLWCRVGATWLVLGGAAVGLLRAAAG